jgi:nicotinamidase-related amidase
MMTTDNAVFVLVDVQGKLAEAMYEKEDLFENLVTSTKGMLTLDVPVLWLEQIPEKMGETIAPLKKLLRRHSPIPKESFSCCGEPEFMKALRQTLRKKVILAGIETHVCVYQTAVDLMAAGYEVELISDAISSRSAENRNVALHKLTTLGAGLTTTEMILLELIRTSTHPKFRDILKLIK